MTEFKSKNRLRVINKINEIKQSLVSNYTENNFVGLHVGLPGIALFFFYHHKYFDSVDSQRIGTDILKLIREKIIAEQHLPTLCTGLAGACWLFDHLVMNKMIDIDSDEFLSDLDEYFYREMKKELKEKNYDFLHGGSGYAIYFKNRYEATKLYKSRYLEYLRFYVTELKRMSCQENNEIFWEFVLKKKPKIEGVNLSLSHGISSLVIILSGLSEIESLSSDCKELILGAVCFLKNNKLTNNKSISIYPSWVDKSIKNQVPSSRLAWCYGDLGIGLCLLKASEALNDKNLFLEAIGILKYSSKRKSFEETKVQDCAICHGAFGVAQIFNSLNKKYTIKEFEDSVDYWINTGLEFMTHMDYAGFRFWQGDDLGWKKDNSLLEGLSGVGLSLIDYLSPVNNKWDSSLLIS